MNLTQNQENYLEIITDKIAEISQKNNISEEYFKQNFDRIFLTVNKSFGNYLEKELNNSYGVC